MNAAVIGLGVGEQHARALTALDGVALRWVIDHDLDRAETLAKTLGAARAGTAWQAAVEDPEVELVSIASFDDDHFAQALAALKAGKHVFCEKPLCRTPAEAKALALARAGSGRALASNLVLRAAPLFVWLREQVRAGALGDIYAIDADYLYGRLEKITRGWRKDVTDYSVMQGGGVHMVDLVLWLTGARPDDVFAVGNRIASAGTSFRYDDYVAATFRFASGMVARVSANFGCVQHHQHALRVYGTRATFVYDDAGARLYTKYDDAKAPPERIELAAKPASKGALIPAFVDAIRRGEATTGMQDLDTIAACCAADRSVLAGKPVHIEYT